MGLAFHPGVDYGFRFFGGPSAAWFSETSASGIGFDAAASSAEGDGANGGEVVSFTEARERSDGINGTAWCDNHPDASLLIVDDFFFFFLRMQRRRRCCKEILALMVSGVRLG